MAEVIGFVGAGQMGEPMVQRLLAAGREVVLYARRSGSGKLGAAGATIVDSVAQAASRADVLILCLFSDTQLSRSLRALTVSWRTPSRAASSSRTPPAMSAHYRDWSKVSGRTDDSRRPDQRYRQGHRQRCADGAARRSGGGGQAGRVGGAGLFKESHPHRRPRYRAQSEAGQQHPVRGQRPTRRRGSGTRCQTGYRVGGSAQCDRALQRPQLRGRRVQGLGDVETFSKIAGPFLRKDVKAAALAADSGVDVRWLKTVVDDGPIELS